MDASDILKKICRTAADGHIDDARVLAQAKFPFIPAKPQKRQFSEADATRVFIRDGFIDRYSGRRLVFPGTLRLLSVLMPKELPFHRNWATDQTHVMYWELFPTIDHVVPISRGGKEQSENWVTTSMLKNSAKSNWTLEELGWQLKPPGNLDNWDGLMGFYIDYLNRHPDILRVVYLKRWYRAAQESIPR